MRTFAFACAIAAVTARRSKKEEPKEPEPVEEPVVVPDEIEPVVEPEAAPAPKKDIYEKLTAFDFYAKNIWEGCYQGLYGMAMKERPSEECFGEWIPEKMKEVNGFYGNLRHNMWNTSYEDSMQVAYDQVDLLFLNDEYCLFRKTWWDLRAFCHQPDNCHMKDVFDHMQTNAFSLITQVSQAVAIFKQEKWADMDRESRGYALNQLGHSFTQVFTDLFNFDVKKIPADPWAEPEEAEELLLANLLN